MPRIARAVAVGFPHHIIQRGNNKEKVFFEEEDRQKYLELLKKYSDKWECPILAYCLMNNHVHLLVRPKREESLYKMMQGLTLCYTQYINRKYEKTGRLWESRYHSCIVDREHYLWAAARYIEQNPKRAKIVKKEEEYPYSSARAHVAGRRDDILGEKLFNDNQRKDYIAFIRESITEEEIKRLKYSTRTGRPFGREEFIKRMEKKLNKRFILQRPGRPKGRKS
ncbi:MAG: transposase [Thermodesulfovibrionales bacterium]|jgi:putative transposase|nr:transposase [Thermodesulfovibrionales bacterium]